MRFSMNAIAPLQTAAFSFAAPKAIAFLFSIYSDSTMDEAGC
ncbi:hypothetical protein [Moorena producens]|nr:hypothetical protein [Moorena producens]